MAEDEALWHSGILVGKLGGGGSALAVADTAGS